jgi:hypothetical protein
MPESPIPSARLQPFTDGMNTRAKALLRPLSKISVETHHFRRDQDLLHRLQDWLSGGIFLAGNRVALDLERDRVYQVPNFRPDCNGYVAHITNTEALAEIISKGNKKTKRASKILTQVAPDDILYGSFHWLRHIKQNKNQKKTSPGHPEWDATDIVEDIYWLDVIYRVGELALPLIRIYYNSIGVAISRRESFTLEEMDSLISQPPYFIESNTVILGWHELAERLSLHGNLYYLRACFSAAQFDKDVIATKPGPRTGRRAVVYLRPGQGPSGIRRDDYHARFGPESTSPRFDYNRPYENQSTPFKTLVLTNLQSADLTDMPSHVFSEIHRVTGLPRVVAPKPVFLESPASRQFVYFVTNQFPGIRYEGDGYFSVTFGPTEPSAVGGIRGSGWIVAAATIFVSAGPAGAAAAIVVGVGAGSGLAGGLVGDAITQRRRSDPERQALKKRLLELAKACSEVSKTEAECKACVEMTGTVSQEEDNLFYDSLIENAAAIGVAAALGCGGGALVGFIAGLIGGPVAALTAPIGCGVGALIGVIPTAGAAALDIIAHATTINTFHQEAFGPCDTVEMQF